MKRDVKALVQQMTVEEKTRFCGGNDHWHLRGLERLGIPVVSFADGPHGLRKQVKKADHLGINESIKAVCFPSACAFTASFDRNLLKTLGEALGEECQAEDISVLLGPAINLKRSPLCGRNFEYMSEDPYLTGESAAAYITGLQSKHIGTSPKHYAANNQEFFRTTVSSEIDERTLRELYLTGFEIAVKKAKPWTLMCSYNRLNGVHVSENYKLLTEILRDEWGFEGYVMSDWYAVNNRVEGLKAGLDLEMPYSGGHNDEALLEAVRSGALSEETLNKSVERILTQIFEFIDNRIACTFDREKHHALAARISRESSVLLKNDGALLPLRKDQKLVFIGGFAETPRYQGGGSSHINPHKVVSALEAAKAKGIEHITYIPGFPVDDDITNEAEIARAVEAAKNADAVIVFAGLPDLFESEGYDRDHIRLPEVQNKLIAQVAAVQPKTAVVLHNGSAVEMPWITHVPSVLEVFLGGQAVGEATIDLLFGDANPSGKLAESFPLKLADTSCYEYFPGDGLKARYNEGIFVGYRHYDYKKMEVLFPFGHGLSYTTFAYSNLVLEKHVIKDTETLKVTVEITNTGTVAGKEVAQLYIQDRTGTSGRPIRELKGFEKLDLAPGETKTAVFVLDKRSFAWYHTGLQDWYCAEGEYDICIGASSRDLRLTQTVTVKSTVLLPFQVDMNTTLDALLKDPRTKAKAISEILEKCDKRQQKPSQMSVSSRAIDEKRRNRGTLERPLRNLYMVQGIPYDEVVQLIADFNALLKPGI